MDEDHAIGFCRVVDHPLTPFGPARNFLAHQALDRIRMIQAAQIFEPRLQQPREKSVFGAMADKNRKIMGHVAKPD
jgi:hypothetical protein